MNQGAIKWAMDIASDGLGSKRWIREQMMDQKASKLWSFWRTDGSQSNQSSNGSGASDGSGSKGWIKDKFNERWIREQAIGQGALEGAMDDTRDGSGSKR